MGYENGSRKEKETESRMEREKEDGKLNLKEEAVKPSQE